MTQNSVENEMQRVRRWLDALRGRAQALGGLLDVCGLLVEERLRTRLALAEAGLPGFPLDEDRLARGVPQLADISLAPLAPAFRTAARRMLPGLARAFPEQADALRAVLAGLEQGRLPAAGLMEALVRGDEAALAGLAAAGAVAPGVLAAAAAQALRPVLELVGEGLVRGFATTRWMRGNCPVCGGAPDLAVFRPAESDGEFLKSFGGQRWLRCGRCSAQWRIRRHLCPNCGNEEQETLEYFTAGEAAGERGDVCWKCRTYLPGLDVREMIEEPDLDVAALAMLPLGILLRAKGLSPLVETASNTLA